MKIKIGKTYYSTYRPDVLECMEKSWVCKHDSCILWSAGYRVHIGKLFGIKFLVWEQDTVV